MQLTERQPAVGKLYADCGLLTSDLSLLISHLPILPPEGQAFSQLHLLLDCLLATADCGLPTVR